MSKMKLAIVFCVIAIIFAFLGDCKMSCTFREKSGDSVSVPENQKGNSEADLPKP